MVLIFLLKSGIIAALPAVAGPGLRIAALLRGRRIDELAEMSVQAHSSASWYNSGTACCCRLRPASRRAFARQTCP